MADITCLKVPLAPALDSPGVCRCVCQAESVPHCTHKLCISYLYMSRHRERMQPRQRSQRSCGDGPRLATPFHSQCKRPCESSVSPLGHQTCVQLLDSRQDFIHALLVSGHRFRGTEPAVRSFRVYILPHLREFWRISPRQWLVVLWACMHGLLCHRHCRQISSMCLQSACCSKSHSPRTKGQSQLAFAKIIVDGALHYPEGCFLRRCPLALGLSLTATGLHVAGVLGASVLTFSKQ